MYRWSSFFNRRAYAEIEPPLMSRATAICRSILSSSSNARAIGGRESAQSGTRRDNNLIATSGRIN
jgi:hypothetical protein